MSHSHLNRTLGFIPMIIALAFSACGPELPPVPTEIPTTVPTFTVTPIPLAVSVNGEGITTAEFQAELTRYQKAQLTQGGNVSAEAASQVVLTDMINALLLEQGAKETGFVLDESAFQTRVDALAANMGGTEALAAWETAQGYTEADFQSAFRRQVAAAWMRDQIAGKVPPSAEQVHVSQILLYNAGDAQQALGYLQAGWDFSDLAAQYDPLTKGELGWFPRGYLVSQAIEQAAFALQPGQYSPIIEDETGFHILYMKELDPARLLSPDALITLQEHAVANWLAQRRSESTILLGP